MDNVTHTLVGALVARAANHWAASDSALTASRRDAMALVVGMVGSNLPDADFLVPLFTQNKLDYLSQHRGYTHTVVGIVLGAMLISLVIELWCKRRRLSLNTRDRMFFACLGIGVLALHVTMDYTNSYGVHPFWPLQNAWFYGDAVFIAEPALWIAAAPLFFLFKARVARVLIGLVLVVGMGLSFGSGWILVGNAIVLAVLMVVLLWIGRSASPGIALATALGTWVAITGVFVICGHIAARRVESASALTFPGETMLDHVLTPLPSNPLCWDVIAVVARDGDYGLRRGVLSLVAGWECKDESLQAPATVNLQPIPSGNVAGMHWQSAWRMPRAQLRAWVDAHCDAQILMRFARAPFAVFGERSILGDLRYDRGGALSFATIEMPSASNTCSGGVPPWIPPRLDLLSAGG